MDNIPLRTFVLRANELIESKLILTDKTISNILKFIAASPALLDAVRDSLTDISYAKEFARAKTTITQADGSVQEKLKTPPTDARLFTFVVCLLTEFDGGKRDLVDFLQRFYTDADNNAAYARFAEQFLRPFKSAGEKLLSRMSAAETPPDKGTAAESYFNPERVFISRQALDEMNAIIDVISEKAGGEVFFSQQERADAKEITLAMKNALLTRNPKLIKIAWIGFYHTLTQLKNTYINLKKLGSILAEHNLI